MLKSDELSNPRSCMSKAKPHEMTFVLLARDRAAPLAIRFWCLLRVLLSKNRWSDPQIQEALACANHMAWQRRTGAHK